MSNPKKLSKTPKRPQKKRTEPLYDLWIRDNLDKVKDYIFHGGSLCGLADKIGVAASTVYKWRRDHPEFEIAIRETITSRLGEVEESMVKRAIGYEVQTEDETVVTNKEGDVITHTVRTTTKHYPGDVKAGEFILTNGDPEKWNRKSSDVNVELPGVLVVPATSSTWTDDVAKQQAELKKTSVEKADEVTNK